MKRASLIEERPCWGSLEWYRRCYAKADLKARNKRGRRNNRSRREGKLMAIYKRGGSYWYEFIFEGRRIRRPAKTRSRKAARDIESAYRIKLAKGEVGLEEPKRVPTFAAALKEFLTLSEHQHAARPSTHKRYEVSSKALKRFIGA